MDNPQKEFENFLRSFQPLPPAALPTVQIPRGRSLRISRSSAVATLALAATMAICLVALRRTGEQTGGGPVRRQTVSSVRLTRLAVENPDRFNRFVDQKRLPRFDRQDSALHSLARD